MSETDHANKKWGHLRKILERSGPFDTENFEPSKDILEFLMTDCKILVIGKQTLIYLMINKSKFPRTNRCWWLGL